MYARSSSFYGSSDVTLDHFWNLKLAAYAHSVVKTFGPQAISYTSILELDRSIRNFVIPQDWRIPESEPQRSTVPLETRVYRFQALANKEICAYPLCVAGSHLTLSSAVESTSPILHASNPRVVDRLNAASLSSKRHLCISICLEAYPGTRQYLGRGAKVPLAD